MVAVAWSNVLLPEPARLTSGAGGQDHDGRIALVWRPLARIEDLGEGGLEGSNRERDPLDQGTSGTCRSEGLR
jgi:hypothetical protein